MEIQCDTPPLSSISFILIDRSFSSVKGQCNVDSKILATPVSFSPALEYDMAQRREISTDLAPAPGGPYSQAMTSGNLVFISGQLGFRAEDSSLIEGGIRAEAELTFQNVNTLLKQAGASVRNLVKVTVLLKDLGDFEAMNEVYQQFVAPCDVKPARTTFQAGAMPKGSSIEVDAIAML